MSRLLFVCSRNRLRSPTAEAIFAAVPGIEAASAGLNHDAETPLTADLVAWADIVFVMERSHRRRLATRFQRLLGDRRVVCLDIPDRYDFMDPVLVRLIEARVRPHLRR
jgi:predicted protein tyrosine phosphatase